MPMTRTSHSSLLALVALSLVCSSASAAIPANYRYSGYALTPSGKIDTRYKDGNDGAAAIPLVWQTVTAVSVATGATGSRSERQLFLTEAGSPAATLSIVCTPTLAGGFSLGTDGLQWSSTSAYSGLCTLTATRLTASVQSNQFRVEAIAPASSDVTAPIIPTGIAVTPSVGQLTVTADVSSDPYVGEAGSGVASYDVRINGSTVVATPAVTNGLSKQLTQAILGSYTPTATAVQSGADWTLTSSGSIDGLSDLAVTASAQVTGDACITTKVNSVTSTADFPKQGVEVRGGTSAAAARFSCAILRSGTNYYAQSQARSADGNEPFNVSTSFLGSNILPVWVQSCRVGNAFSCKSSLDGGAWSANGTSYTLGLPTTAQWGVFAASQAGSGGATTAASLQQVSLNNIAPFSYVYNTTSATTISLRANDVAGNHSAYSVGVLGTPTSTGDTTPPTFTAQPSGTSGGQTSINWNLGTCTDGAGSGVRGYIPYTKTSSGGTRTAQPEQASNQYTQTGLSSATTYYLDSKCVDLAGNVSSAFSTQASATTDASPPTLVAPTGVAVSPLSTSSLRITWNAGQAHHYRLRESPVLSGQQYTPVEGTITSLSFDRTGMNPSESRCFQVGSSNVDESLIVWSTGACGTTNGVSGGQAINAHFGNYVEFLAASQGSLSGRRIDQSAQRNQLKSWLLTNIANEPSIQGAFIIVNWAAMEGPGQGDYTRGITALTDIFNTLRPYGKRIWLGIETVNFGNYVPGNEEDFLPDYIVNGAQYGFTGMYAPDNTFHGISARTWQTTTSDRVIALNRALCQAFGNEQLFEGIGLGETALAVFDGVDGFSVPANLAQIQRQIAAARADCPKQALRIAANDLHPDSLMLQLFATAQQYSAGIGGPDIWLNDLTQADRVFNGRDTNGNVVGTDWREILPWISEYQWQSTDGRFQISELYYAALNGYTPRGPFNGNGSWTMPPYKMRYMFWYANESNGGTAPNYDTKWSTAILPFMRTHPWVYQEFLPTTSVPCPTSYPACNRN